VKSAQAAAFLLNESGGLLDKYVFIKMLYLADRDALRRWGTPITGDTPVSMEYGPVLSTIYDLTRGHMGVERDFWSTYISDSDEENQISLRSNPGKSELSKAEIFILQNISDNFKGYSFKEMKQFSHALEEWKNPGKSSSPIEIERILAAIGKTPEEIAKIEESAREEEILDLLFT
jgi:uncharacterized phage-associated protein